MQYLCARRGTWTGIGYSQPSWFFPEVTRREDLARCTYDGLTGNLLLVTSKGSLWKWGVAPEPHCWTYFTLYHHPSWKLMFYLPHTHIIFILCPEIYLLLDSVPLKDRKAILENVDCHACQVMVFKNSNYQWFILVLKESYLKFEPEPPPTECSGGSKYRHHFPYLFSSTPGTMPSISFSHHANWQKLVPFASFICLAESVCSLDGTTSQS